MKNIDIQELKKLRRLELKKLSHMTFFRKLSSLALAAALLLAAVGIVSCGDTARSGSPTDIKEAYEKGAEQGYSDGRSHKPQSPDNKFSGNAHIVYIQSYNNGYAKGYDETEQEASGGALQEASFEVGKQYGHLAFNYSFTIYDGKVTWSYQGTGGSRKGTFSCNKDVPTAVVRAELSGVVYWRIACRVLEAAASREQSYTGDIYLRHAKDALSACASQLLGIQKYCPNASQLPETCIDKLRQITESNDQASAAALAQSMANITPNVCHLHGINF